MGDIVKATEAPRCGFTGSGSSDYVLSRILQETLGAKINNVIGDSGSGEIALALEEGANICVGLSISTCEKALTDPELIAQAKNCVELKFSSGGEEEWVRKVVDQPPAVVTRIKRLFV